MKPKNACAEAANVVAFPKQHTEDGQPWSFIQAIESHIGLYTVEELAPLLQN